MGWWTRNAEGSPANAHARRDAERIVLTEQHLAELRALVDAGKLAEFKNAQRRIDLGPGLLRLTPELQRALGQVYYDAGYRVLAGQLWYCLEPTSAEMSEAVEEFIKACACDPRTIQHRIQCADRDEFGRRRYDEVLEAARKLQPPPQPETWRDTCCLWGCGLIVVVFLLTFFSGLVMLRDLIWPPSPWE